MAEKCDFLQVVKVPYTKKRFLFNLRLFFNVEFFLRARVVPVCKGEEENFNEKMSSLAGPKKSYPNFCKSTSSDHF